MKVKEVLPKLKERSRTLKKIGSVVELHQGPRWKKHHTFSKICDETGKTVASMAWRRRAVDVAVTKWMGLHNNREHGQAEEFRLSLPREFQGDVNSALLGVLLARARGISQERVGNREGILG